MSTYRVTRKLYSGADNISEWVTYVEDADYFISDSDGNIMIYKKDDNQQGQAIAAFARHEWVSIEKYVIQTDQGLTIPAPPLDWTTQWVGEETEAEI